MAPRPRLDGVRHILIRHKGYIFRRRTAASASTGLESLYDLQHVLGRGSFATVVKALHKTEGGWYAVKIIQASKLKKSGEASKPLDEGEDPMDNIPAAFRREIEILRRLSHRNICKLKEVFFESTSISKRQIAGGGSGLTCHALQVWFWSGSKVETC